MSFPLCEKLFSIRVTHILDETKPYWRWMVSVDWVTRVGRAESSRDAWHAAMNAGEELGNAKQQQR